MLQRETAGAATGDGRRGAPKATAGEQRYTLGGKASLLEEWGADSPGSSPYTPEHLIHSGNSYRILTAQEASHSYSSLRRNDLKNTSYHDALCSTPENVYHQQHCRATCAAAGASATNPLRNVRIAVTRAGGKNNQPSIENDLGGRCIGGGGGGGESNYCTHLPPVNGDMMGMGQRSRQGSTDMNYSNRPLAFAKPDLGRSVPDVNEMGDDELRREKEQQHQLDGDIRTDVQ